MTTAEPYPSRFRKSCQEILCHLAKRIPMSLWMVTRVNGDEWTVVDVVDQEYGVVPLTTYDWSISFSYRMMLGLGPKIAPRVDDVPAYVSSPSYSAAKIGSYIGIPLELPSGELFGILTGISAEPKSNDLYELLPGLELISNELMHLLAAEMEISRLGSTLVHTQSPHWLDPQTGIYSYEACLFDGITADWARTSHLEPGGIIYLDAKTVAEEQFSNLVAGLMESFEENAQIYRDQDNCYIILLRDLNQAEQQSVYKQMKKLIKTACPESACVHVYRTPVTTVTGAIEESKRLLSTLARTKSAA